MLKPRLNVVTDTQPSCPSPPPQAIEIAYEMAYGLSHELNNPLANIAGRARLLAEQETDPEKRQQLSVIVDQAMRGCEMIADLMLFARPPTWNPTAVDGLALVKHVCARAETLAQTQRLVVQLDLNLSQTSPVIQADQQALTEALWAIVRNAIEAAQSRIDVRVSLDQQWLKVDVQDDGPV